MTSERRFKSWNIFDSGLNTAARGHNYWETKGLVDELMHRGETVRLFSHVNAPPAELFPGIRLVPTFSQFLYKNFSNDPSWQTLENFILHNWFFLQDISKLEPSLFHESLVLLPTIGPEQLMGIFRWLKTFAPENGPKAAICLMTPIESSATNPSMRLYKTVWNECTPELRKRIALFCRTPQNVEMFARHAGMSTEVFPFVIPQDIVAPAPETGGERDAPMMVSFVGGARRERGVELIPDVVKRFGGAGVQFFIQARGEDSGFDIGTLTALSDVPHAQVHEGALERKDYYRVIANSVSLLPYQQHRYGFRDSAVYYEAKFLGAPVLVTAGTWMADEVATWGNGLVIENYSVDATVDCISRAQRELPALRAAAARVREDFHRTQGVARCIDAVAGSFMSRS